MDGRHHPKSSSMVGSVGSSFGKRPTFARSEKCEAHCKHPERGTFLFVCNLGGSFFVATVVTVRSMHARFLGTHFLLLARISLPHPLVILSLLSCAPPKPVSSRELSNPNQGGVSIATLRASRLFAPPKQPRIRPWIARVSTWKVGHAKGPSSSWRCPRPPNGRLSTNGTSRPHQHLWGAGGLFGSARFGSHSDLLSPSQGQLSTCVGATWRLGRRGPRCLPHQRD